jgi:hypothetical protein
LNVIPAAMVDTLDSAKTFPGERFRFRTTAASIVRGVSIPKGTIGWGIVRFTAAASNHARNGAIDLEPRYLVVGTKTVDVSGDPREAPIQSHGQTIAEKSAGYVPVVGLVRSAVNTVRSGSNIVVGPGFSFHVIAVGDLRDVSPCAVQK